MLKFEPASPVLPSDEKIAIIAREYNKAHPEENLTFEKVKEIIVKEMKDVPIFLNDKYQVQIREAKWGEHLPKEQQMDMIWLSIKRIDKESIHDWRELQQIKNEIVGEKNEAIEIYPSEDRIVDTANQYHLWVFKDPEIKVPVGFFDGRRVSDIFTDGASKQRPFDSKIKVKVPRRIRMKRKR